MATEPRCKIHGKRLIASCAVHGGCSMCCIEANPNWREEGFTTCKQATSPQAP